jgi:uncharacterized FlaG/YvyC family protein
MTQIESIAATRPAERPQRRLRALPEQPGYEPPAAPPADLADDLAVAQHVIAELQARQVSLHFEMDEEAGRVRVQVTNAKGEVLREIPTRKLLDTLAGGGLLIDLKG